MSAETATKGVEELVKVGEGALGKFQKAVTDLGTLTKDNANKLRTAASELAAEVAKAEGIGGKIDAIAIKNPKAALGAAIIGGAIAAKLLSGGSQERGA